MTVQVSEEFEVSGEEIELEDAESIKRRGYGLIDAGAGPFQVDLEHLKRANSVSVAVLLAWYRRAMLQDKRIFFVNLSEDLHNIVEFSGLSRVLLNRTAGM